MTLATFSRELWQTSLRTKVEVVFVKQHMMLVMEMDRWVIWILIVAVALVGSIGNILWKVASNHIGQISWNQLLNVRWYLQTLFTPLVFTALFLMFVGRFMSMVPSGYMGITQLITSITILTLVFTAVLDVIILETKYPLNVWIGIIIGFIAIYLISYSVER